MITRKKRIISIVLAVLMALTGLTPLTAFADDGVIGYYDIELFYDETQTIVPSYADDGTTTYIEYMIEGDTLQLTYKLIDTDMPDNASIYWYSETPTLVDVDQTGLVKAFDSSKGAVVQLWIDNEVATIPLIGSTLASVLEKAFNNDYVDVDTMDTDEIIAIAEAAFGSDSLIAGYVENYEADLLESLEYYLDNINSNIHVQLIDSDGTVLDDDYVNICVQKNEEWYANFLPNGTHITNKDSIETTVAVGSTVQLYAVTTPVRLHYNVIYSVKSSSIFDTGKVVATVNDSGLVTFKNTGTVTIMVSPDTEEIIEGILEMVNYFYALENTGTLDTDEIAGILIDYVGLDINRTVLAGILDVCFAIYDVAEDTADPVQLTATAVEIISNLVLQFVYNDTITFTVVDGEPITDFNIDGTTTVKEGSQIQLNITDVEPTAGDTTDITWSSADPSIASVDPQTGIITGRDAGGSLGNLSTNQVDITATSAANNVSKTVTITVTGKTGRYISDAEIIGDEYLEIGETCDYGYTIYPARVAEGTNLYTQWGMVTGEDDDGNLVYSWCDDDNPTVTDSIGQISSSGSYEVIAGGVSTIALKAYTGYYLSDGSFYEISSIITTFDVTNGIPIESITIEATGATSNGELNSVSTVTINGNDYTYATIYKNVMEAYAGNGATLEATVYPTTASNQNLTWVIDNTDGYSTSVSDDTLSCDVTQKAGHEYADTFNVYAVSEDGEIKSNVITICVTRNPVTDNTIDQDSIEMIIGQTASATHTVTFDGSWTSGAYACYDANWYSSDEDVFTVENNNDDNNDATLTGVDVGTATLYCVSADGGIVDTCEVTVYPDKTYLKNIIDICENTAIERTSENRKLYNSYSGKLDLACYVYNEEPMASQVTCDTYANELLTAFYKLGGFITIGRLTITDEDDNALTSKFITVECSSNYSKYSYDLNFKILPEDAMYSDVVWSSSNDSIIVDKNGICKTDGNNAGAAIITCTCTDYLGVTASDSVYVAFSKTPAQGVSLDTTSISGGKIGETQTITATVLPDSLLSSASNDDVFWTSSDESIATVDENGVVTFVAGGDCVVTCTTIDGGYTATCDVNVVTNFDNLETLYNGYNDLGLTEVNYYPDSWAVYTAAMEKASNILTARTASQKVVDNMYTELQDAYNSLEKYNYIQNIELYLDGEATQEFYQYDLSLLKEGISYTNASLDLNVRLYPNNGSYESIVWSSSTTDISVTTSGVCSPTINASCYGMITCTLTDHFGNVFEDSVWVSFSYYPVTALVLSEDNISGAIGDTYQLSCVVEPTGSSLLHIASASITDYYWESENEDIATVDENGLVTFVSAGSTVVKAVSYDGGVTGTCTVSTEGDRSALKAAIDTYGELDYMDYEYDYSAIFNNALAQAESALTDNTLSQDEIDEATEQLNTAAENMLNHPYTKATDVDIAYTTYKKPLVGSASSVESSTVSTSTQSLSVNLGSGDYSNYNNYNYVTLTATPNPSDAMYASASWSVDETYQMDTSISDNILTLTPSEKDSGATAVVTYTIVDHYGREISRTIVVSMSDNVCTGVDITLSSYTMYATDDPYQILYTISGDPEFTTATWTSSDESVATVDSDGLLTAVDKGTATVTVKTTDGGYSDSITINVLVDFSQLALKASEYNTLIDEVEDSYVYTEESLEVLSQAVSDANTMVSNGSATQAEVNQMIQTLDDAYNALIKYEFTDSLTISVVESQDSVEQVKEGYVHYIATSINNKTIELSATLNPVDAVYDTIEWTSSNSDITVSDGVVTNTSASAKSSLVTCTVTNPDGTQYSDSIWVTFARNAVTGISFDSDLVYGPVNQTAQLSPTVTNTSTTGTSSFSVTTCQYTSSDESVATVDENGLVTFVSQGTAIITAITIDGGYEATITAYTTWDTTALEEAIADADSIVYTDYEYDYAMVFNTAYENAQTVVANIYSTQEEIDTACTELTEAMSNLEEHPFIDLEVEFMNGESVVSDGAILTVDDNNELTLDVVYNDDAMIKSFEILVDSDLAYTIDGDQIILTRDSADGYATVTVNAVDDYDRDVTYSVTVSVIGGFVYADSVTITCDGEDIGSTYTVSCGGSYTYFEGVQLETLIEPEDVNSVTSIEWTSSATTYVTVDDNGLVELTSAGKFRSSNTATITVTVTNDDGSTVTDSVTITITRA